MRLHSSITIAEWLLLTTGGALTVSSCNHVVGGHTERRFGCCWLVFVAGLLGTGIPSSADASCVGPVLGVGPDIDVALPQTEPTPLMRGQALTVTGRWFHLGCNDTSSSVGSGCSGRSDPAAGEVESPMLDVDLVLVTGSDRRVLGTADATTASPFAIRWRGTVPIDAATGPATLQADTASVKIMIIDP